MHTLRFRVLPLLLITVSLISIPLVYADHEDHDFVKKITIDNTDVDSVLTDFPLLLNFTDSDLSSNAFSDGLRITFTNAANSTELSHEIDQYTTSNGWLTAWVKVPTISNTTDTNIFMWYGNNTNIGHQNSTTATWNDDYEFVGHFEDSSFLDSTANNNDGTNTGTSDATGYIGDARFFDGINDDITLDNESNFDFEYTDSFSLSAWLAEDSIATGCDTMFAKGFDPTTQGFDFFTCTTSIDTVIEIIGSWSSEAVREDQGVVSFDGTYHLYQMTYDGTAESEGLKYYFDGVEQVMSVNKDDIAVTMLNDVPMTFGVRPNGANDLLGTMDEIRILTIELSADWIDFEFCNQVVTGTCEPLTISGEEEIIGTQTHTINVSEIQWIIDTDDVTLTEFFETHTIDVSEIQWIIDSDTVLLNEGSEVHTINVSEIQWIIDTDDVTNDFAGVYTPSGKYIWFNCSLASNSTQGCIYAFFCPPGQFVNGFWENGTASCSVP